MCSERPIDLETGWKAHLTPEFKKEYMAALRDFLKGEIQRGKTIFPHGKDIFNAFNTTPFDRVKTVIIGQDPYHGPGQAHGLCFSVRPGVPPPPSLLNIFRELQEDLGISSPSHGNLKSWAQGGVLLLNSVLTVERGRAASHQNQGWETFTDTVIEILNTKRSGIVFLLWGSSAQRKGARISLSKHMVLKAPHPSPLSAHRGFFGCRHFSKANDYLQSKGETPIDWSLSSPVPSPSPSP